LDHPEWLGDFFTEEYDRLLNSEELSDFLHDAASQHAETRGLEPARLLESIQNQGFRQTVERALFEREYTDERARQWFDDCVRTLKRNWADRTLLVILHDLEGTDFERQRNEYEVLIEKQKQVIQFKQSL
jgi:lipoate synthase